MFDILTLLKQYAYSVHARANLIRAEARRQGIALADVKIDDVEFNADRERVALESSIDASEVAHNERLEQLVQYWSQLPPPGRIDPAGVFMDADFTVSTCCLVNNVCFFYHVENHLSTLKYLY